MASTKPTVRELAPGSSTCGYMPWGLSVGEPGRGCWGARAIYSSPGSIDLVWDRQAAGGEPREARELCRWVSTVALKAMSKALRERRVGPEEDAVVEVRGGPGRSFVLVASPRRSYGYLYLGAGIVSAAEEGGVA